MGNTEIWCCDFTIFVFCQKLLYVELWQDTTFNGLIENCQTTTQCMIDNEKKDLSCFIETIDRKVVDISYKYDIYCILYIWQDWERV